MLNTKQSRTFVSSGKVKPRDGSGVAGCGGREGVGSRQNRDELLLKLCLSGGAHACFLATLPASFTATSTRDSDLEWSLWVDAKSPTLVRFLDSWWRSASLIDLEEVVWDLALLLRLPSLRAICFHLQCETFPFVKLESPTPLGL